MVTGPRLDEPYLRETSAGTHSLLPDALGSILMATDAAQATVTSYSYDAYGATLQTGTNDNSQQYTGRENDGTGLYYYRARYYSPQMGRFISQDPIGWASGQTNNYAYVRGNPITKKDPTGLIEWNGTVLSGTLGYGVMSGGVDFYTLRSQCVNGKRVVVKVKAQYVAAGLGAPWSYTGSSVTFNNPFSDADPNIFNGDYSRVSSSASFGGGYGWSAVQMGHAGSAWSGSPEAGLDLTYLSWSLRGRSQVTSTNVESCGCE